jgi:hypothetical protein
MDQDREKWILKGLSDKIAGGPKVVSISVERKAFI